MLKRYSQVLMVVLFALDMLVATAAWGAAYTVRFEMGWIPIAHESHAPLVEYFAFLPILLPLCAVIYHYGKLYVPRREDSILREAFDILKVNGVLLFVTVTAATFYKATVYSRLVFLLFVTANFLLLSLERACARSLLRWIRSKGWNLRYCLVVGAGKAAQNLVDTLRRNSWTAIRPIGYLDSDIEKVGREIHGVRVIGTYDDLVDVVRKRTVDQVFFALPFRDLLELERLVDDASREMVDIRIVPDFFSFRTLNSNFGELDGLPVISLQESPLHGWHTVLKRATDVAFSLAALAIFALPMALLAALVKLTSPGPVFYRQKRMGLDGRLFDMLKFRTMPVDAESESGPVWARPADPRRTGLGAFLRNTSLDELPQFLNVLRGEMSIVGPRPERPVFIQQFREQIPNYMLRHRMKAGITGWAQVNGWRGNTSLKKRIQYDLYYIENWSIWFD
ncbi:MAG: undecaprenyl-phosphate glucose phosphotransferase, partial [Planctomycetes bacterium]|nr:undecaprenyl-phosphate glucose phosphotransferase [Planctomycetota bacterium]